MHGLRSQLRATRRVQEHVVVDAREVGYRVLQDRTRRMEAELSKLTEKSVAISTNLAMMDRQQSSLPPIKKRASLSPPIRSPPPMPQGRSLASIKQQYMMSRKSLSSTKHRKNKGSILAALGKGQSIVEEDQEGEDSDVYDDEEVSRRRRVTQKYQTASPIDADLVDRAQLKSQIKKKMIK